MPSPIYNLNSAPSVFSKPFVSLSSLFRFQYSVEMTGASSPNPPKQRKRVEAETPTTMKRAKDGSAFTKCEACKKDVAVGLIDMHDCGMDSKIKMNLNAQVVEKVTESKKPDSGSRKRASAPSQSVKKTKKEKKSDDAKKNKRTPTAFFLFMDDFRKEFKEANPDNKKVAVVAKEGGAKWKSMTDEEKKPYLDRAAELKAENDEVGKDDANEEVNQEEDNDEIDEDNEKDGSGKEEE